MNADTQTKPEHVSAKPTPGPWRARSYKNSEGGIWIDCEAFANRGKGRCLGGTLATAHASGCGKGSLEANAALIASAPDLLEAVLVALPYLEGMLNDPGYKKGVAKKHAAQLRAAIARAEGAAS